MRAGDGGERRVRRRAGRPRPPVDLAHGGTAGAEREGGGGVGDARARVPLSELSRDFGLPGATSPEQDFPDLAAFCKGGDPAAPRPAMPVVAGGSGGDGWYWMELGTAQFLRHAIRTALSGT